MLEKKSINHMNPSKHGHKFTGVENNRFKFKSHVTYTYIIGPKERGNEKFKPTTSLHEV
jgi:hypothetical protein